MTPSTHPTPAPVDVEVEVEVEQEPTAVAVEASPTVTATSRMSADASVATTTGPTVATTARPSASTGAQSVATAAWGVVARTVAALGIVLAVCAVMLAVSAGLACAATAVGDVSAAGPVRVLAVASLDQVLANLRNWLMSILVALATTAWMVAAFRYMAADGNPSAVGRAKDAFKSGAWGFCAAALAPVVIEILGRIVGV